MLLRIYSDLHLEFGTWQPPELPDDPDTVLILAGDIWTAGRAHLPLMQWATRFRAAILVLGNHDYYQSSLTAYPETIRDELQSARKGGIDNAYLLDCTSVVIDDVAFVGAPLWTSYQTPGGRPDPLAELMAERAMADFREIVVGPLFSPGTKPLRASRIVEEHRRHREYLETAIREHRAAGRRVVVITHHLPSFSLSHPKWEDDALRAAFASSALDEMPEDARPDVWIFGHQHETVAQTHCGVLCVSNPRGYPGTDEVLDFDERGLGIELSDVDELKDQLANTETETSSAVPGQGS